MRSKTGYNRLIVALVILPIMLRPFFEVVYERLEFILKQLEKFWNLNLQSWQKYDGIPWTPFLNDSDNRLAWKLICMYSSWIKSGEQLVPSQTMLFCSITL